MQGGKITASITEHDDTAIIRYRLDISRVNEFRLQLYLCRKMEISPASEGLVARYTAS
jgi:hypothetical protein